MIEVRINYIDSLSGDETTEDIFIAALNAQAIADAINNEVYDQTGIQENLTGVHLHVEGGTGAFILRNDHYLVSGMLYTKFDKNWRV